MIKRIVFLGAPGVGKGTIASKLSKEFGIPHISTGNIFRKEVNDKTPLGLKVVDITSKGGYVPDEITNEIVKGVINSSESTRVGYLLDGYPRTINQSKFLKDNSDVQAVILLEAPKEVIVQRLSGRRACDSCKLGYHISFSPPIKAGICDNCGTKLTQRIDDQPEAIQKRLKIYDEQTLPLIEFYEKSGLIKRFDSSSSPEDIFQNIKKELF